MTRNEWIISSVIVAAMTALPIALSYILVGLTINTLTTTEHGMGISVALFSPVLSFMLMLFTIAGLLAITTSFFIKQHVYTKAIALGGLMAALLSLGSIAISFIMFLKHSIIPFFLLFTLGLLAIIGSFFTKQQIQKKATVIAGFIAIALAIDSVLFPLSMRGVDIEPFFFFGLCLINGLIALNLYLYYRHR